MMMMSQSHPSVHPLELLEGPPVTAGNPAGPRVRMKDIQGMPGTPAGLALRLSQFVFAVLSLCVMSTTSDFPSVTAFRHNCTEFGVRNFMQLMLWTEIIFLGLFVTAMDLGSERNIYLVAAVGLQSLWSLSLTIVDIHALLVKRCLRNSKVVSLFTIGDGITSTLTFAAASAAAGITVLVSNDFNNCEENHCTRFETATAMAFMSWFAISPSFLLNFWSLASMR
ncbi:hypothetical protein TEA_026197 [Camellia sinensis var. sinensis]|uniref:CASP-like protein n=1 Tax=Camellia sinensis var. sinensis TaxID=542762 RepID=A0A4S4F1C1_CAMSN|nr:hypothetical protein TEA_026197 [Camellia sinensis var. sinensis]